MGRNAKGRQRFGVATVRNEALGFFSITLCIVYLGFFSITLCTVYFMTEMAIRVEWLLVFFWYVGY